MTGRKCCIFRSSGVEVRERELRVLRDGQVLTVEPRAFRTLLCLLRKPNQLLSKEEIQSAVWGETAVSDNSLTRAISVLRKVLDDDPHNPRFIETVSTIGYRFVGPVEVIEDSTGKPEEENQAVDRNGRGALATPVDPMVPPERTKANGRRRLWLTLGATSVAAALAFGYWYLRRPLLSLRVTTITQITYDGAQKTLIGTDGSRLYFDSGSTNSIAQVSVTGGAISTIPVSIPNFAFPEDVSADGANFLIATNEKGIAIDRPQWNVRLPGGSLLSLPAGGGAAFSPDGNSVAYETADGALWVAGSDGSGAHELALGQSIATPGSLLSERGDRFYFGRVAWSPDGRAIRFEYRRRLWEISASGTDLHEVIPGWHLSSTQCCGSWTPDGRVFVFLDVPGSSMTLQPEIWALSERGELFTRPPSQPVRLTTGPIAWGQPIPAKDGKKIFATGKTRRGELARFDLRTRQLQPFLGGISAQFVSFSKDGQFVAYVSYPEGILWRAKRDGSNAVQLTDPPINALLPRWSPDGTQILFWDFTKIEAYVVPASGGNPQRLLPEYREPHGDPNWSADGKKVVFTTTAPFNPKGNLRILDLATHQVTAVTGSEGLYSPRWSPDGRFIAALRMIGNGLKIFDRETEKWSWLTQKYTVRFPSWSRDSQSIYFIGASNDDTGVYRIRVGGGDPEHIADLKGIHLGGFWSWMGLDPTDTPLVLRDTGSDDIYALTLESK